MSHPEQSIPTLPAAGTLAERVRDALAAAINTGVLAPGTRLREIPLSEHFGLSKTPVREGLRLLEADGLVVVSPRRGAVVTTLDEQQVRDLYQLRLILEGASARLAAESGQSVADCERIRTEMANHINDDPQIEFHHLDVQLHRAISALSGNAELTDAVARLHQRIQAVRGRASVIARCQAAHAQHGRIVAAIKRGDGAGAEAAMREHISSARDHVLASLAREGT